MHSSFRNISLRQVTEDDMPFLFRLFSDPSRTHLWLRGRRVHDERGFHHAWSAWCSEVFAAKFLVESAGRPVGLVLDYDRTLEDGFTKATTLLDEASIGHGGGVIATALFGDWLFKGLPFRKIYLEVYGYNRPVVGMLRKLGLPEEGVLRADRYWDGVYWDMHIFALYREAWADIRTRLRLPAAVQPQNPQSLATPQLQATGSDFVGSTSGYRNGTH